MAERVSLDRLVNEIEQSLTLVPTWPEEQRLEAFKRVAGLVEMFQDQITRKAIAWQATARVLRDTFKDPVSADAVEAVLNDLAGHPPEEELKETTLWEVGLGREFEISRNEPDIHLKSSMTGRWKRFNYQCRIAVVGLKSARLYGHPAEHELVFGPGPDIKVLEVIPCQSAT